MRFDGGLLGRAVVMTLDRRLAAGDAGGAAAGFAAAGLPVGRFLVGGGTIYPAGEYGWVDVDAAPRRQAFNYASAFRRVIPLGGGRPLLYLEDDAELAPGAFALLPEFFAELAACGLPWDLAHLGGNHTCGAVRRLGRHLLRSSYSLDLHAVAVHPRAVPKLLAVGPSPHRTIDGVIADMQSRGELLVLGMNPPAAYQKPGFSFNENRWDDKTDRHRVRYW